MPNSLFRPCIDLHSGQVKQIVGGTLDTSSLKTNFVATQPAAYFASLYCKHDLKGGHVIQLGPGNREAALEALVAWPGGLQIGGGITEENALEWLDAGAEKVQSYLKAEDILVADLQSGIRSLSLRIFSLKGNLICQGWSSLPNW